MMSKQNELKQRPARRPAVRARPGPVRKLDARPGVPGTLVLYWQPPAGGRVVGYRIERTREGRVYEPVGEVRNPIFFVRDAPFDEPWFYRVTAFNARGVGGCRLVWLYRRSEHAKPLIVPVVVVPGLRVTVCEWFAEGDAIAANCLKPAQPVVHPPLGQNRSQSRWGDWIRISRSRSSMLAAFGSSSRRREASPELRKEMNSVPTTNAR